MSAWKKPSRNTCVKKISTPARASARDVDALLRAASATCEIGVPCMRCITITRCAQQSQYTAGTRSSGEPAKLRPSWLAFAASRMRSSSSSRWRANSATTSRGFRRRPSAHQRSTRPRRGVEQREVARDRRLDARAQHLDRDLGAVVQPARGAPGRPRRSRSGCASKVREHPSIGLPSERSTSATASSDGNGGTRSCSLASSSAMSSGSRSRRVESTWPNLTKIGPSVSSASRSRCPRVGESGARSCSR